MPAHPFLQRMLEFYQFLLLTFSWKFSTLIPRDIEPASNQQTETSRYPNRHERSGHA
jgi:hypothetical protein